ncbi:MAG TPA: hypothetical protein VFV50_10770, partial [Bdellovibrionales bacterium]|nr:hypothetical protein [Bdellovibrionales bacterium]
MKRAKPWMIFLIVTAVHAAASANPVQRCEHLPAPEKPKSGDSSAPGRGPLTPVGAHASTQKIDESAKASAASRNSGDDFFMDLKVELAQHIDRAPNTQLSPAFKLYAIAQIEAITRGILRGSVSDPEIFLPWPPESETAKVQRRKLSEVRERLRSVIPKERMAELDGPQAAPTTAQGPSSPNPYGTAVGAPGTPLPKTTEDQKLKSYRHQLEALKIAMEQALVNGRPERELTNAERTLVARIRAVRLNGEASSIEPCALGAMNAFGADYTELRLCDGPPLTPAQFVADA